MRYTLLAVRQDGRTVSTQLDSPLDPLGVINDAKKRVTNWAGEEDDAEGSPIIRVFLCPGDPTPGWPMEFILEDNALPAALRQVSAVRYSRRF